MRKLWFVTCSILLLVCLSSAKEKLTSQWSCGKPSDSHSIAVDDQANHAYAVSKTACTSVKSDLKEKDGVATQFDETSADSSTWHGIFISTTDGGDKIHYKYESSGKTMIKDGMFQSGANKWTIVGGTGKYASAKGDGTCSGKGNADGTVTWDCSGTYTAK